MEFDRSDSSGTDDDFPPSHRNKFKQADHATGNGRLAAVGSGPFPRVQNDMETQIHNIEQEAYTSVLRAFKAQSDAITWEKESLITELRKELRVSDEEHRELLSRVNADDIIREIREWRKTSGLQPGAVNTSQPVHDHIPSPTVSAPHKKQKTSQSVASLSLGAPSPIVQPSSSTARQGPPSGGKTKKPKSSLQLPSTGLASRSQVTNRGGCSGAFATNQPPEATSYDPMIGRKVWTRWPDDNHFYEAVITDYNASEGRHALVYDMNARNETWEWVNLKEISPKDIRWEGEDPGISQRGVRAGPGRGIKKSVSRGGAVTVVGRGRGMTKVLKKNFISSQTNGSRRKPTSDIELLHTDTLIKEVEKIFSANHPDPVDMEKAKKMLKEHEQALVNAIARLGDASDGESDGEPPFSQVQSTDREIGWKKRKHDHLGGVSVGKLPTDGSASSAHPREDRHYR
ncbi:protein EMSY-LIKE 3 isoform X1 [Arachis duranensis]|uniref:Protein EMSY-LIKE 3 isoform X1 n=1 Tax=Arachis duranensis TaxID=130453 RepID=A0A6P5MS22_ARADU|nr:protein EMSY-LIKE 3 isoform X1 [Arachis duranensis]XP_025621048.1 protein EMSY-LIKE 3 isoform X2 [Arachis hypogaea]